MTDWDYTATEACRDQEELLTLSTHAKALFQKQLASARAVHREGERHGVGKGSVKPSFSPPVAARGLDEYDLDFEARADWTKCERSMDVLATGLSSKERCRTYVHSNKRSMRKEERQKTQGLMTKLRTSEARTRAHKKSVVDAQARRSFAAEQKKQENMKNKSAHLQEREMKLTKDLQRKEEAQRDLFASPYRPQSASAGHLAAVEAFGEAHAKRDELLAKWMEDEAESNRQVEQDWMHLFPGCTREEIMEEIFKVKGTARWKGAVTKMRALGSLKGRQRPLQIESASAAAQRRPPSRPHSPAASGSTPTSRELAASQPCLTKKASKKKSLRPQPQPLSQSQMMLPATPAAAAASLEAALALTIRPGTAPAPQEPEAAAASLAELTTMKLDAEPQQRDRERRSTRRASQQEGLPQQQAERDEVEREEKLLKTLSKVRLAVRRSRVIKDMATMQVADQNRKKEDRAEICYLMRGGTEERGRFAGEDDGLRELAEMKRTESLGHIVKEQELQAERKVQAAVNIREQFKNKQADLEGRRVAEERKRLLRSKRKEEADQEADEETRRKAAERRERSEKFRQGQCMGTFERARQRREDKKQSSVSASSLQVPGGGAASSENAGCTTAGAAADAAEAKLQAPGTGPVPALMRSFSAAVVPSTPVAHRSSSGVPAHDDEATSSSDDEVARERFLAEVEESCGRWLREDRQKEVEGRMQSRKQAWEQ